MGWSDEHSLFNDYNRKRLCIQSPADLWNLCTLSAEGEFVMDTVNLSLWGIEGDEVEKMPAAVSNTYKSRNTYIYIYI